MKKITKIFVTILFAGILSTSFMLCACNNVKKDCKHVLTQSYSTYDNPYFTDYFDDDSKLNFAEKINSLEELKNFCQEKQFKVFDENDTTLKNDSISKKLKEYDVEFFKDYSIVLVFRFENTTDYYYYNSANIKDNVLTIDYLSANGSTTTRLRPSISIFELRKKIANKIQQIDVQYNLSVFDKKTGIKIYEDRSIKIKNLNYSKILNSIEDVDTLINKDANIKSKTEKLEQILKVYDEEFFKEKSVIVLFRYQSNQDNFRKFKNYEINNNAIDITLSKKIYNNSGLIPIDDLLTCIYIIEFDKEEMANVTQINVIEIEE